jgi:RNA polymerase sigma-70 factor (ECF subfamily)
MAGVSLRAIFDAEFEWVCRTLRRLGVRPSDLEDAAQETFLAVANRLSEYDPARPLRPWLFGFAMRIAANHRRKKKTDPTDTADEHASAAATPEHEAELRQQKDLVLRALEKIDDDRRPIFVMHDIEGFGAPEIATLLSIPVNTVYSRLRTARAEFEGAVQRLQRS